MIPSVLMVIAYSPPSSGALLLLESLSFCLCALVVFPLGVAGAGDTCFGVAIFLPLRVVFPLGVPGASDTVDSLTALSTSFR